MHQLEAQTQQKRYPWIADQLDRFLQNLGGSFVAFFSWWIEIFSKGNGITHKRKRTKTNEHSLSMAQRTQLE